MPTRSRKKQILFLGSQMEVAGAQRVLLSQARWFHAQGYAVAAVFFYDKQGLAEKWQAENDFPVISLKAWKYGGFALTNYFRAFGGMLRLFGMLRKSVDVIECFTPHSNMVGIPTAWLARVPVRIATHHGYIEGSSNFLARMHGWMVNLGLASTLVAVSKQVKGYAIEREKIRAERIVVIENGIESLEKASLTDGRKKALRSEMGLGEDGKLMLTVGRLTVQKGHTVLLKAIAQIKNDISGSIFAFAGEGHLGAALKTEVDELGIAKWVRFIGVRADVADLLYAADIFVQPSLWEGLSLAMLEALLSGVPVLATEVEGVVDVIESGKTGLLVEAGNVEALVEAILKLLGNKKLRTELGKRGRKHAEDCYGIERMCRQYEEVMHLGLERLSG